MAEEKPRKGETPEQFYQRKVREEVKKSFTKENLEADWDSRAGDIVPGGVKSHKPKGKKNDQKCRHADRQPRRTA